MQTLPSEKPVPPRWGQLAHVLAYNIFCFGIILALVAGRGHLPSFAAFVLIPVLWLCTRPSSPVKPRLLEQSFSPAEWRLWFAGAAVFALALPVGAYASGVRDALELFQAVGVGVASWAFLFLTFRDCRRTLQHAPVTDPQRSL